MQHPVQNGQYPAVNEQGCAPRFNWETSEGFETMQRVGKMFASSRMIPAFFKNNVADATIALDIAYRLGVPPLQVMQNMYEVHGKIGWSAQFLIALLNASHKFTKIRFQMVGEQGKDDYGCFASCIEKVTGEELCGPLVTVEMAKKEGWYNRPGSKWPTLTELMLRYRAAAFMIRTCAPEIAMGLYTADELRDMEERPSQPVDLEPAQARVVQWQKDPFGMDEIIEDVEAEER